MFVSVICHGIAKDRFRLVTLLIVLFVPSSNVGRDTDYTEVFLGFRQSLQTYRNII